MDLIKVANVSEKGHLEINVTDDVIYIVESNASITIKSGVNAKILDNASNSNINIDVQKDAVVNYYILESNNSNRLFNVNGEVVLSEIGLDTTEETLEVNLLSENARFNSKCLSFANGNTSIFHTNVKHSSKMTFSEVSNIGVAMKKGKLSFDVVGKIYKGMAKSKCAQLSRGIVMDNESKVDAKPILLIDEFDCFANHGASIGKVSDDDLFYLMSRGLTKDQACLLILEGVIRPFIDAIPLDDYKQRINDRVSQLK